MHEILHFLFVSFSFSWYCNFAISYVFTQHFYRKCQYFFFCIVSYLLNFISVFIQKWRKLVLWWNLHNKKQVIYLLEWESSTSGNYVPRPRPFILGFYTHTPLFSIHGTIFPSVNSSLSSLFSHLPPTSTYILDHWEGIKPMTLRKQTSSPNHLASGALMRVAHQMFYLSLWSLGSTFESFLSVVLLLCQSTTSSLWLIGSIYPSFVWWASFFWQGLMQRYGIGSKISIQWLHTHHHHHDL